jgi:hypothetical protein
MARYGLASHVFVCRDEDYVVILDVREDRYFALEAAGTAALSTLLPGWPALAPGGDVADPQAAVEVALPLQRRGWLLEAPQCGKDATPVQLSPPWAELTTGVEAAAAPLAVRSVLAFLAASIFAKLALRFWRFERVIRRVRQRKEAHARVAQPLDLVRARQLVDVFGRLRVFLFSSREECLHDSLALLEFLARHGLFPGWVFAVRARPFAAHCWVQQDSLVFNDTVEHVSTYAPIMVV